MTFVRVWIHYVWSTKNREPILMDVYRDLLFEHMKENATKNEVCLDRINGYDDHVHSLVSLGSGQTIQKIAQILKGESSFWFNNKSGFDCKKLAWQNDYFAVSVSESALPAVRSYIDNQVNHHCKVTFEQEYQELMKKFGFQKFG